MSTTPSSLGRPRRWDAPFSADMPDADVARLLALSPFKDMNPESFPGSAALRDILKNDTCIRRFKKGEIIVRQGDYGNSAFMVLAGEAQVVISPSLPPAAVGRREEPKRSIFRAIAQLWSNSNEPEVLSPSARQRAATTQGKDEIHIILQDIPAVLDKHKTATLEAGVIFGEIAALSRIPRTATIFAHGDGTELLEMRWQGLRDLMKYDPKVRAYIDKIYRVRALSTALSEIPFMKYLSEEAKKKVADATQFETYGDYEWSGKYKDLLKSGAPTAKEPVVAGEEDYPNNVVIVRTGFARVTQGYGDGHRTLNYLGAGQVYGFEEIAHNWRNPDNPVTLQYTLRVMGYTHVLVIPAPIIEEFVLPAMPKDKLPPVIEQIEGTRSPFAMNKEAKKPLTAPVAGTSTASRVGSNMMEFLTQNRFFNGTESMVIDLDRCTRCDDCVRACAATHDNNPRFLRHGPIIDNIMVAQACMHCTDPVCMIGCPTGAIHRTSFGGQVVINPDTCIGCTACANSCPYGNIRMVESRDDTGQILAAGDSKPILKATKCDLCIDQLGGPACERACPHDALKRINLNTLDELVDWIKN